MESKYYTPEIEEFFYGFKYEFRNGDSWKELIFNFNKTITGRKLEDLVRVKYLDQQDIEDCGWSDYTPPREYNHQWKIGTLTLMCWFNMEIPKVRILDYQTIIFHGDIKNKSELKKLMKQLNITKE